MGKVKVLLASNHELWWEGLFLLMERSQNIEVLPICYDATQTIEKAIQLKPDILLLDEEIEGADCGEVAQRINDLNHDIKIIIVIKPYKTVSLSSSFKSRARAYLDKDITYTELENCIQQVHKGAVVVISSMVAQKLLDEVAYYERRLNARAAHDYGLSKREKEVLKLLAKGGIPNKEIAGILNITENTVKAHLTNILEKMQVRNRQQAAIRARESGILPEIEVMS